MREASRAHTCIDTHKLHSSNLHLSPVWFTHSGCPLEKAAVWVLAGPEGERSPLVTCQTYDRKYWDMVIIWYSSPLCACVFCHGWNVRNHVHYTHCLCVCVCVCRGGGGFKWTPQMLLCQPRPLITSQLLPSHLCLRWALGQVGPFPAQIANVWSQLLFEIKIKKTPPTICQKVTV